MVQVQDHNVLDHIVEAKNRGALNFYFGIRVRRPEGPNWGACERITTKFGTLVNLVFKQNVALCTESLSNLRLLNGTLSQIWGFGAEIF